MIAKPLAPLPWRRCANTPILRDAADQPVSFVQNGAYVEGVVLNHAALIKALREMTDAYELVAGLAGVPQRDVIALVDPVRDLLKAAEVEA